MIGTILFAVGSVITIRAYGWLYLLAFVPLWALFGYFLGIPPIVNVLRTRSTFMPKDIILTLCFQGGLYFILVVTLRKLGMNGMETFFLLGGAINAFSMPIGALLQERSESPHSR